MEMPRPGATHERLHRLAGTWIGEEALFPSPWAPDGAKATSRLVAAMQLDGFFLISDYEQRQGGKVSFRGHGVYGVDLHTGRYTMHWFDTMGFDPGAPAIGTWDGDELVFRNESPMGHGRYTYTLIGDGRYRFEMASSSDGESWQPLMDAIYVREP